MLLSAIGCATPETFSGDSYRFCERRWYIYGRRKHVTEKEFIRDGKRRIIGSVTTGYVGSFETIVRDEQNNITGSTSERFNTTRDEHGNLVSINTADAGLLIGKHNKK